MVGQDPQGEMKEEGLEPAQLKSLGRFGAPIDAEAVVAFPDGQVKAELVQIPADGGPVNTDELSDVRAAQPIGAALQDQLDLAQPIRLSVKIHFKIPHRDKAL